jgi:DNA-binding NarL/FixJ family response regulator
MQKPFKIQELLIKVESILGKLKHQRAAIVSKAYQNILAENGYGIAPRTVSYKRCAFTENCKKYRLTAREVEIIKQLIKGLPYKLIGDQLSISDKTVAKHISNIFTKVEVNNKVELMNRLEAQEILNYPESKNV